MQKRTQRKRMDRGSVMVIAALAMMTLLLFAALVIDVGFIYVSRTQSQNADDSAALAAASAMINRVGNGRARVDLAAARAEGKRFAGDNTSAGTGGVNVTSTDFEFGYWDLEKRTLDTGVDLTKLSNVTGARVTVRRDGKTNQKSPTFIARLLGINGFQVVNTATAYRGFDGEFMPGEFNLPVAIDSCPISTAGCGQDFCEKVKQAPNSCDLRWRQGSNPVTCLDFSATGGQNACWTGFDGSSPGISNRTLQDIIDSGNPGDIRVGDKAYLDNGAKAATLQYLRDKFYGCNNAGKQCGKGGQKPAGADLYGPNPPHKPGDPPAPDIDSWVVKLPVFQCQKGAHCSGGGAWEITGGVCFEIREVLASAGDYTDPSNVIKGRFLCPDSDDAQERALFDQYCRDQSDAQAPGGCDYGLRIDRVVLVK